MSFFLQESLNIVLQTQNATNTSTPSVSGMIGNYGTPPFSTVSQSLAPVSVPYYIVSNGLSAPIQASNVLLTEHPENARLRGENEMIMFHARQQTAHLQSEILRLQCLAQNQDMEIKAYAGKTQELANKNGELEMEKEQLKCKLGETESLFMETDQELQNDRAKFSQQICALNLEKKELETQLHQNSADCDALSFQLNQQEVKINELLIQKENAECALLERESRLKGEALKEQKAELEMLEVVTSSMRKRMGIPMDEDSD